MEEEEFGKVFNAIVEAENLALEAIVTLQTAGNAVTKLKAKLDYIWRTSSQTEAQEDSAALGKVIKNIGDDQQTISMVIVNAYARGARM